jgi:glycosyltransferase involved in cell wall biosynthesis
MTPPVTRPRVLYVCHNHPDLLVGGVEVYVKDLYEAMRDGGRFEPLLLARAGLPFSRTNAYHDAPLSMVGTDPNQYILYTDFGDYDNFYGRLGATKSVLSDYFGPFLLAERPDVIHFHHTANLGYDMVRVARNALPDVPIVFTLHEYMPICNRDGVMVRATNEALCEEESPRRCHECFPGVTPQAFYMRKRFIQSHLGLVDLFIAPSDYVKARYVQWGLPESKIEVEQQGCPEPAITADVIEREKLGTRRLRNRFAYFGTLNPYKGADVLLKAMDLLGSDYDSHLWMFGANLEKQSLQWQKRFGELAGAERPNVTFVGDYDRSELGKLMARIDWVIVPSNWWETGPLVVWEAFQHGRPVIASDIGGQSEKVTAGVNGMHFRRGDAADLARAIKAAAETPGLWDDLHAGIPERPGHAITDHVAILTAHYERLLAGAGLAAESERRIA